MMAEDRLFQLGRHVASMIEDGTLLGLGTGSTAEAFLHALGERINDGLTVSGVATSEKTVVLAHELGIRLLDLNDIEAVDAYVDGADEIDPNLSLVKGRGGALLHEKLVASHSENNIIIASHEKLVLKLGTRLPIPVEVVPFGWKHTSSSISHLNLTPTLRQNADGTPYVTDGGHYILDCQTAGIDDPAGLGEEIKRLPGVVEHGLFVAMVDQVITIDAAGEITEQFSLAGGV